MIFLGIQENISKNAIVDYLEYHIPVTQLKGRKGNGDMQAAKRDWIATYPWSQYMVMWAVDRFKRYGR